MFLRHFLPALAFCLAALPALAVPGGVVEGLQPPAMLLRDGLSFPLVPGTILKSGDRLVSGAGISRKRPQPPARTPGSTLAIPPPVPPVPAPGRGPRTKTSSAPTAKARRDPA